MELRPTSKLYFLDVMGNDHLMAQQNGLLRSLK